jgi:hypothetical protein
VRIAVAAVLAGVVALVAAVALAVMPFDNGPARCTSPLSGGGGDRLATEGGVQVVVACDDDGAHRLLIASGLVVVGIVLTPIGVGVGFGSQRERPDAGPTGRAYPISRAARPAEAAATGR